MADPPKQNWNDHDDHHVEDDEEPPPIISRNSNAAAPSTSAIDHVHRKVPSYLQGTRSSNNRSRSAPSLENNNMHQHRQLQSTNLDPTGMFRNRGRRVINSNYNNVVTASSTSPAQQVMLLHSTRNLNVQRHRNRNTQQTRQMSKDCDYLEKYDDDERIGTTTQEVTADGDVGNQNDGFVHKNNISACDKIIEKIATTSTSANDDGENQVEDNPSRGEMDEEQEQRPRTDEIYHHDNDPMNDSVNDEEKDEFVPTITLESLQRFELFQGSSCNNNFNQMQNLHSKNDGMITRSLSNDSDQQCHSAIGSTVSVMGSLVGEGDHISGSFGYDENRLAAVKRRMMQDVEEIDETMSDDDNNEEDKDDSLKRASSQLHSMSDEVEAKSVNESIECNTEENRNKDEHCVSKSINDIVQNNRINENDSDQSTNATNNDGNTNSSDGDDTNNVKTIDNIHDESPLRAAFRRKTQSMTSALPPLSSQLSVLTPNRFHSSYAKTENAVANGLKIAQHCFSFEDTTVDDSNFLVVPEMINQGGGEAGGVQQSQTHKYYGLSGVASFASEDDGSYADRNTPKWNPFVANSAPDTPSSKRSSKKDAKKKWYPPMSGGMLLSPSKARRHQIWDDKNSPIRQAVSSNGHVDPMIPSRRDTKIEVDPNEAVTLLRSIVMQSSLYEKDVMALHIDSLHCESCQTQFGKQSAAKSDINCPSCLEKVKTVAKMMKPITSESCDNLYDDHGSKVDSQAKCAVIDTLLRSHEYGIMMKQATLLASKWLESLEAGSTAEEHIHVREVTEESFETAERRISIEQKHINRLKNELSKCRAEIERLKFSPREQQIPALTLNKSILSESSSDISETEENKPLNLASPSPAVKRCDSHDESYIRFEKRIEADLNLENRKEIIFLKAALEKANKRIFDLEHVSEIPDDKKDPFKSDIEAIEASNDNEGTGELIIKIAENIENISVGSSLALADEEEARRSNPLSIYSVSLEDPALEKELEEYRAALIASLRIEESNRSTIIGQDLSNSISSEVTSDNRMVNVRMIDGENFTTEWGDLVPPLPPPPDHDLKSPIVDAILSKWTDDSNTQSALITWIEDILNGTSSNTPSLKLSGLDHQIRDGFIMHVLPLLLRRKDIHVHVTSRAHRQTTYDIAVSISHSFQGTIASDRNRREDGALREPIRRYKHGDKKHHLLAYQATHSRSAVNIKNNRKENFNTAPISAGHFLGRTIPDIVRTASNTESISTAVTTPISNRTLSQAKNLFRSQAPEDSYTAFSEMKTPIRMASQPPALGDNLSVESSASDDDNDDDDKSQRKSSIIGSISGAFGGLISRRKGPHPPDLYHTRNSDENHSTNVSFWSPSAFFTPQPTYKRDELRHDDIHHRVVSVGPGKIGLTFVEYEGNTMVSNVSDSSPLSGWVFPSDVLVAIDDTPVRGLRTRDVVQILTEKKDQQRNLRIYSLNRR